MLGVEENHASSYGFASDMISFNSGEPKSENVDPEVLVDENLRANANNGKTSSLDPSKFLYILTI